MKQGQWMVVCILSLLLFAVVAGWADEPDRNTVDEKIGALGLRDDSLAPGERSDIWLTQRLAAVTPRLIERLDDRELRVAEGCLAILQKSSATNAVLDALVRIAGNEEHAINRQATLAMCRFEGDPRVKTLLSKAVSNTRRFPNPQVRAQFAVALGDQAEAVRLIVPLLKERNSEWDTTKRIEYLGQLGHTSAIAPLENLAKDKQWGVTVEAYLALARIDPQGHGLTRDQEQFLRQSRRTGKTSYADQVAAWRKLAALDRQEIRPYVLQMITSDQPQPGLVVLQEWKDRDALPEIVRLMTEEKTPYRQVQFKVAYLDIEDGNASVKKVIDLAGGRDHDIGTILSHLSRSTLSPERKLLFFREVRNSVARQKPWLLAENLGAMDGDSAFLLRQLIRDETNVIALARYAQRASSDGERRFGKEILLAMEKVSSRGDVAESDARAVQWILEACAAYGAVEAGALADPLLQSAHSGVRVAAARVVGRCGSGDRERALSILHAALSSTDASTREEATAGLLDVSCRNKQERNTREQVVLSHLGQPTEDSVLRVLLTCCGAQSVSRLMPLLDGENVPRALHAAWILAHGPDEAVPTKALRRLAIYAMFNHQVYQQGEGIDFRIVHGLDFHQVTRTFRPGAYERPNARGPKIPAHLLQPLSLDKDEQAFSVRAYRHVLSTNPHGTFFRALDRSGGNRLNDSYLPLLRAMAVEDPWLDGLHVKGRLVAHFPIRKQAAQALAAVTGGKATYRGLGGEKIDSASVPSEPYPDQNRLIARYAVDFVARVPAKGAPQSDAEWHVRASCDSLLRAWSDTFGEELKNEIRRQADQRDLTRQFTEAGFQIWREAGK